jgi:phosphoserine phosphatase RsbU/P
VTLAPGEVVALYSDGISEASDPDGAEFGAGGVARTVGRHASDPSSAIVAALYAEVQRFTGGAPASDDRTVLIAKVAS